MWGPGFDQEGAGGGGKGRDGRGSSICAWKLYVFIAVRYSFFIRVRVSVRGPPPPPPFAHECCSPYRNGGGTNTRAIFPKFELVIICWAVPNVTATLQLASMRICCSYNSQIATNCCSKTLQVLYWFVANHHKASEPWSCSTMVILSHDHACLKQPAITLWLRSGSTSNIYYLCQLFR